MVVTKIHWVDLDWKDVAEVTELVVVLVAMIRDGLKAKQSKQPLAATNFTGKYSL